MHLGARLALETLSPRKPATVILLLTDRCNAACSYCFNPHVRGGQEPGASELSPDEYAELARANGPWLQVALGGGEPFLRSDIDEIVAALCVHARVRLVSIPTNGSLSETIANNVEAMVTRFGGTTFNLMVSIDAHGERHDALRGMPGLFGEAIGLCHTLLRLRHRHPNLNVIVNTTIGEHNLDDIPDLCRSLAREFAGQPIFHNVGYDQRIDTRLFAERDSLEKILGLEQGDTIRQVGRRGSLMTRLVDRYYIDRVNALLVRQRLSDRMCYRCNAGSKLLVVTSDGTVGPCEPFLFEPCYRGFARPNIRDHGYRFGSVRAGRDFQEMLAFIARGECRACPWSCAAITSVLYDPRNWANLLATPSTATLVAQALRGLGRPT